MLSPEGTSLLELQALTRRLVQDKTPVLTFTLHSTSLTAGANVYAPDAEDVDEMLRTSAAYLRWFKETVGGDIVSLKDLDDFYAAVRS